MKPEELQQPPPEMDIAGVIRVLTTMGLSTCCQVVRRLACEMDTLREQSARDHAAWEAMRRGDVVLSRACDGRFLASMESPGKRSFRVDPVDAVLSVAEPINQEGER